MEKAQFFGVNESNVGLVGGGANALGSWANNMMASIEKIDRIKNPEKYQGRANNQITSQSSIPEINAGKAASQASLSTEENVLKNNPELVSQMQASEKNLNETYVAAKKSEGVDDVTLPKDNLQRAKTLESYEKQLRTKKEDTLSDEQKKFLSAVDNEKTIQAKFKTLVNEANGVKPKEETKEDLKVSEAVKKEPPKPKAKNEEEDLSGKKTFSMDLRPGFRDYGYG